MAVARPERGHALRVIHGANAPEPPAGCGAAATARVLREDGASPIAGFAAGPGRRGAWMTIALAWLRKHATYLWAGLAFVGGLLVAAFARRRPPEGHQPPALDPADIFDRRIDTAK